MATPAPPQSPLLDRKVQAALAGGGAWGSQHDAAPIQQRRSRVNLRFINWIWHVRGSVPLAPGQSSDDAFARLDPLFHQPGTSHARVNDTLTFRKKDQAAQDRMSIFDDGVLRIEQRVGGSVLRYDMNSRTLLFCFLAPLLFLAFAQLTIVVTKHQQSSVAEKVVGEQKRIKKEVPLNPIDKFLGAPAPEKPKKGGDESGGRNRKPSTTPAYVFAGMFAILYVVGRILEDRLVKSLFRKRLLGL